MGISAESKNDSDLCRTHLGTLPQPGDVFETVGGSVYQVLGRALWPFATNFTLKRGSQLLHVTGDQLANMEPLKPAIRRFASLFHQVLASREDLGGYIQTAITKAGYPLDPTMMDWATWLGKVYGPACAPYTSDRALVDELLHDLIVDELYRKRVLETNFDPQRGDKDKPLENKVSAFLVNLFYSRVPQVINSIQKSKGIGALGELGRRPA